MIYGNQTTYIQLYTFITKILYDESQKIYPFIIIAGPAHIGKSSMIYDIIQESDCSPYDVAMLRDLSDDWLALKESNDLTGTSHSIQIEVESKRQDIRMSDGTLVHNWGIRELQDWLVRSPLGKDKIVVIEAIERATGGASNAMLKTLEEPLPHRLMIATTHSISQLPPTIASRAMIFHMDRLDHNEMKQWITDFLPDYSSEQCHDLMMLATGRLGLIKYYETKGLLKELIASRKTIQGYLSDSSPIAQLYQYIITINKAGYLSIILEAIVALAYEHVNHQLYQHTLDLIRKQDSNVNLDNLLFEWVIKIKSD